MGHTAFPKTRRFRSSRVSLLDRGVIYAIAHVRGGGELGEAWHEGGRMMTKNNTFTDFVACADYLADNQYTAHDRTGDRRRQRGRAAHWRDAQPAARPVQGGGAWRCRSWTCSTR